MYSCFVNAQGPPTTPEAISKDCTCKLNEKLLQSPQSLYWLVASTMVIVLCKLCDCKEACHEAQKEGGADMSNLGMECNAVWEDRCAREPV